LEVRGKDGMGKKKELKRCSWVENSRICLDYHDREWGVPLHDDRRLFEMLVLEGAQAGLNWMVILRKREHYRVVFDGFDPVKVSRYGKRKIEALLGDPGIVRNRRKVESAVANARGVLDIQSEFGSLDSWIWQFVGGRPVRNGWKKMEEIPALTAEAGEMSRALKKRGFSFVGPTICYAFMQAVGMVNDHVTSCYRHREIG
jgi:DNA-3-methyladenine glycosylase I